MVGELGLNLLLLNIDTLPSILFFARVRDLPCILNWLLVHQLLRRLTRQFVVCVNVHIRLNIFVRNLVELLLGKSNVYWVKLLFGANCGGLARQGVGGVAYIGVNSCFKLVLYRLILFLKVSYHLLQLITPHFKFLCLLSLVVSIRLEQIQLLLKLGNPFSRSLFLFINWLLILLKLLNFCF